MTGNVSDTHTHPSEGMNTTVGEVRVKIEREIESQRQRVPLLCIS